jgi:hypothetical protein
MPPRRVWRPHTSSSILSPCPHTTYPPLPAVAPVEEAIPEEKRQRYTWASMLTPNAIACTARVLETEPTNYMKLSKKIIRRNSRFSKLKPV